MAFAFLNKDNFKKVWSDAEEYNRRLQDPFREYERISRNRPHTKIPDNYPKVTDGTLASIISETPKRYIQQIPTGHVEVTGGPKWLPLFANFKLQKEFIPKACAQADPLVKSWNAGSKSMTYGSQDGFVFLDQYNGKVTPNFKLPFITDVYLEKGKLTDKECNVIFMRAWYQTSDIEAIIEKEKKLAKSAKERGEKYESSWNIKLLEELKDKEQAKEDKQKTPAEKDSKVDQSGIEIIHGFQCGIGRDFLSWSTTLNKIVRIKKNKDPRGKIPLHRLYCNLDLSNPYGRGVVEQSGGKQNLLDSNMQAFQYNQALMLNPPIKVRGNVRRGTIKYIPNGVWDLSNDPNADVTPVEINTTAITNFNTTYGLLKSQILNENSSLDTSVSSEAGNPGFSKTPAGVKANEMRLGVSDNYLRKQYEAWFQEVCETMLNLYFAEMSGVREEQLDSETADKIRAIAPDLFISEDPEEDTIVVDYDLLGDEPIYFEVDASSSQAKDDADQLEKIQAAKEILADVLSPAKQLVLANRIISKLGLENPEELQSSKEEIDRAKEQEQMAQEQQDMQQEMVNEVPPEAMPVEDEMPVEEPFEQPTAEGELDEEDYLLGEQLQQRGYSDEQVGEALVMMKQEMPVDEILAVIGEPQMEVANG